MRRPGIDWTGHASAAFQWTALWPLIGVCLAQGRTGDAVAHGAALLAPELMRLPAEIEDSLGSALACWEHGDEQQTTALLSGALTQAQRTGWL